MFAQRRQQRVGALVGALAVQALLLWPPEVFHGFTAVISLLDAQIVAAQHLLVGSSSPWLIEPTQSGLTRLHGQLAPGPVATTELAQQAVPVSTPPPTSSRTGPTRRWTRNGFFVSGSGVGVAAGDRLAVAVAGGRVGLRVVWSRPLPSQAT
ncbi:MAG TPA: hypothetical protein VG184_08385, partial [Acidimicrobiales bacterium]|nr:hypothetical protein [Acidimicrobiales bacterium]